MFQKRYLKKWVKVSVKKMELKRRGLLLGIITLITILGLLISLNFSLLIKTFGNNEFNEAERSFNEKIINYELRYKSLESSCLKNSIEINTANKEELIKIYGIGEVYAQRIIDGRNFSSVDELINVNGIGELTLEKIKKQGCVYVNESFLLIKEIQEEVNKEKISEKELEKYEEKYDSENNKEEDNLKEEIKEIKLNPREDEIETTRKVINLTPQNIKTEKNNEVIYLSKSEKIKKYAIYGFALFCVGIITLLIIDRRY